MRFNFYTVSNAYYEFLRQVDQRIPYLRDEKSNRPFVGIVFTVGKFHYFAPLTSPKPKHLTMKNQVDFIKIKNGELGAINLNNMIPVQAVNLSKIELKIHNDDAPDVIAYKNLLANQLSWCNSNRAMILEKAEKLYVLITSGSARDSLIKRCCNFQVLEQQCIAYQTE